MGILGSGAPARQWILALANRTKDKSDRYHFWDYESADGPHTLSLLPERIVSIDPTEESFDPAEFVRWEPNWHYPRDWGNFS